MNISYDKDLNMSISFSTDYFTWVNLHSKDALTSTQILAKVDGWRVEDEFPQFAKVDFSGKVYTDTVFGKAQCYLDVYHLDKNTLTK